MFFWQISSTNRLAYKKQHDDGDVETGGISRAKFSEKLL